MGNIIKFEFRKNFSSLIVWTFIALIISLIYLSVFPSFEKSAADFVDLLKSYPPATLKTLNINLDYIDKMEGFYPMVVGFVQLVSFAFAATLTLKIFCYEYKNKSVEFLLTKPRSRAMFFHTKILTVVFITTIYFIVVSAFNYLYILYLGDISFKNYFLMQFTVYMIILMSISFTSIFAIKFSHIRAYGGVGFIIAFGFYALNMIGTILNETKLQYLSIYGLFDLNKIVMDGYNITVMIVLFLIIIILHILGRIMYVRKDVL